ncbi:hypothetical protein GCM10022393_29410 [Aquimarina addita]|uniref:Right handed beta helix domain-containing protein n=1 Tax=Aquimarina addita TaxID=870485 RepID=A0ABP6UMX1_9FLAO
MKKRTCQLLIFTLLFISCSNDENVDQEPEVLESPNPVTATTACLYEDLNIEANSTIILNCLLDLKGKTIEVPAGVTFTFDGGDIFNGTLNFSGGGKIDDYLLNSELTVIGNITLTSDTFSFYSSRWKNIVEGEITSEIALTNNHNLEALFEFTKSLGASTFKIDRFDAYFHSYHDSNPATTVVYSSLEAINVPSNFNLVMTDNTHLRVFPGLKNESGGNLMALRDVENVTITGGTLHGDRDSREYPDVDADQAGSHLLKLNSARNVVLDGMTFLDASTGSLNIFSIGFRFNPDTYIPSTNIIVKNNTFKNSRRMSLALTDGDNIQILNNSFIDNDQDSTNSQSGEVGYAINIEPTRTRDDLGNLVEYERVYNVLIKGNTETNSRNGFLSLYAGQDITVDDNTIDTRMSWNFANGARYINNTFNASGSWASGSWAFFATGTGETVFDNEFSGNKISGYSLGIVVGSVDADIYENIITNVTGGIQISSAIDATIYDNIIESSGDGLRFANTTAENVKVTGNTFTSSGFMARITNSNNTEDEEDFSILIDNNDFLGYGAVSLYLTKGVTFSNNIVQGGLQISDTFNSIIDENTITPNEGHGIRLFNEHENITISNNNIQEPTGADRYVCIKNESTTPTEIELVNNTCN